MDNVTKIAVQLGRNSGKIGTHVRGKERSVLIARFDEGVDAVDFDDRRALGQISRDDDLIV